MYLHAQAQVVGAPRQTWRRSVASVVLLYLGLLFVGWAFGVGCSRIFDTKHHPADVAAGWVLGGAVSVLFAAWAIGGRGAVRDECV